MTKEGERPGKCPDMVPPWRVVVKGAVVLFIKEEHIEQEHLRRWAIGLVLDELPRRLVFPAGVGPGDVEGVGMGLGLGDEVGAAGEAPHLVELGFHEAMDGLDICLVAVLSRVDGAVDLAGDGFYGPGEGRGFLGLPASNELTSLFVRAALPRRLGQVEAARLEVGPAPSLPAMRTMRKRK